MKVYIAGPMTGYPEFNYPAFFAAEKHLRDLGHEPINPARSEGREGCKTWLDFMRAALRDLADCEGIGHDLGLPVAELTEWERPA